MNRENFKRVYIESLREVILKFPQLYAWKGHHEDEVIRVASRMFEAMDRGTFNHDSKAYKLTAKKLRIKPTRSAILAYWNHKEPEAQDAIGV